MSDRDPSADGWRRRWLSKAPLALPILHRMASCSIRPLMRVTGAGFSPRLNPGGEFDSATGHTNTVHCTQIHASTRRQLPLEAAEPLQRLVQLLNKVPDCPHPALVLCCQLCWSYAVAWFARARSSSHCCCAARSCCRICNAWATRACCVHDLLLLLLSAHNHSRWVCGN